MSAAARAAKSQGIRERMYNYLDFEKPVADLEGQILELKKLSDSGEAVDVAEEISRNNVALHGDLDDPTDGPLDQAALRRHGDAVDLVRQDTQDHCIACGHKGEVAS